MDNAVKAQCCPSEPRPVASSPASRNPTRIKQLTQRGCIRAESSTVYVTKAKAGAVPMRLLPTAQSHFSTQLPVTVLVNDRTASASEILAGALQDNCRAVLAGGRTYGKGLIQSVYELADSSGMVVTVGKYLTPSGSDIDKLGILPDFRNQPTRGEAVSRLAACRIR